LFSSSIAILCITAIIASRLVAMALRVLFVTNMWPDEERPWHGTFVKSQADSLERGGVDVDVLPIRGWARRAAYPSAVVETLRRTRGAAYDVVHAHYGHSAVVARAGQWRSPLVVSFCGDDLLGTRTGDGGLTRRSRVEAAVFRQLGRTAAATITKSREMEQALPATLRARNHVIPNGVDLDRFRPIPREEARARLGWEPGEPVALFVGNPEIASKNYALAQEVHRRLEPSRPGLRLRVAASVAPEDVPVWMSAADALLFTSRSEGSPNVIKEAMAAELPIVSTPVGDVRERLAGVEGCHVCEADPDALAAALAQALDHGRAPAARRAVEPLGLDAVARRVVDVYEGVLARSNGRP
jgi:teichuronic acid biosynthesis glycosyltransferase TuaC